MTRRFSKVVPKSELELERFFLDTINKLEGTNATLEEIDQRSTWPGASVASELERSIANTYKAMTISLRSQIDDLERIVRSLQGSSVSTKIDELERRIDSIEKSARF